MNSNHQETDKEKGTEEKVPNTRSAQKSKPYSLLRVVGAVIVRDGLILCAQRGIGKTLEGYWEFPGGKIEPHETPQEALQREITEELCCKISVGTEICTSTYDYDFATVQLTTFICRLVAGQPQRTEHTALQWLAPHELSQLQWPPVDRDTVALLTSGFPLESTK